MVFQDCPQPVRDRLDLLGPGEVAVELVVDLGQHFVQDEAGGQRAHAQRVDAVRGDDGQGLGDHAFAGQGAAAVLVAGRSGEPQPL
jgi:hypothetical protein